MNYVSSSDSGLGEEDRAFAKEMGLPTGDEDLQDSETSETEDKATKVKLKAKETTIGASADIWGIGGGRWGSGDDRGDSGSKKNISNLEEQVDRTGEDIGLKADEMVGEGSPLDDGAVVAAESLRGIEEKKRDGSGTEEASADRPGKRISTYVIGPTLASTAAGFI